jgi:alkylation response protein AidB-like acyl-CoA dehydrogenase
MENTPTGKFVSPEPGRYGGLWRKEADMDFTIPVAAAEDLQCFNRFIEVHLKPHLPIWYKEGVIPRRFFQELGEAGWLGFTPRGTGFVERSALQQATLFEALAKISPGVAVAVLVQISLGSMGVSLFGSDEQKQQVLAPAIRGDILLCLGNTELKAGSDVANVALSATETAGGYVLNGTKAYVTNGAISDMALITAVTDAKSPRSQRLSMFLVDLASPGATRTKLHKQVWIPSDLTRLTFKDVFVPDSHLVGPQGRGLQQVLEIFSHSRVAISALTLGTAVGAFELGLDHARKRDIFGQKMVNFQAKSFEIADLYTRMEAARLVVWKACWAKDQGKDFRLEASMAKYLTVQIAQEVSRWAADLFGAASVIFEHPIHKYPMDAWASSLGEGTQDVQKLIIFREIMKAADSKLPNAAAD